MAREGVQRVKQPEETSKTMIMIMEKQRRLDGGQLRRGSEGEDSVENFFFLRNQSFKKIRMFTPL